MKSYKTSSKTPENLRWNRNKASGWRKVVTTASIALAWFFASCDKIPNDQIILDGDKQSVALSFKYQFGWPEGATVDHNATIQKKWDIFECIVEKSNWISSEKINIKSDNLDWLFEELANRSDSEYITENTRAKRNSKLNFAKQVYKDSILNNENPSKWEIRIKYKK